MAEPPKPRKRRRCVTTDGPHPIDLHVGGRVRQRRQALGMSQEKLAEELGITFQQVQKYERGANRIGASRLFDLSRVLSVEVTYFYEGMPDGLAPPLLAIGSAVLPPDRNMAADPTTKRETLDLVKAYYKIEDPAVRRRVLDLARTLAVSLTVDE